MACSICNRAGHDEEFHEGDPFKQALEDAAVALEGLVESEVSEGRRNSYVAQTARGAAKKARATLGGHA